MFRGISLIWEIRDDISWTDPPACAGLSEGYTLILELCEAGNGGACKTVKLEDDASPFLAAPIAGMKGLASKGLASKGDLDILTAFVRVKHAAGARNNDHATGESGGFAVDAD